MTHVGQSRSDTMTQLGWCDSSRGELDWPCEAMVEPGRLPLCQ